MKRKSVLNGVYWVFSTLPILIAGILLFFLPDRIPIHWPGFRGEPNLFGSKYIVLLVVVGFFAISFAIRMIMRFIEKSSWEGNNQIDKKFAIYSPPIVSILFFGYIMWLFWMIMH